jgi:hypothetical protein
MLQALYACNISVWTEESTSGMLPTIKKRRGVMAYPSHLAFLEHKLKNALQNTKPTF